MRIVASIGAAAASFVAGMIMVVACSDDSPGVADAATCSCPAAEPPLTGRIAPAVMTAPLPAGMSSSVTASCPAGATLLGGGCRLDTLGAVLLEDAGPVRNGLQAGYICEWRSNAPDARMGTAEAICLMPAQ